MRTPHLTGLLAAMLLLTGCSTAMMPDPYLQTRSIAPRAEALVSEVAPEFAAAFLPAEAGAIQSVRQTAREHYLRQEIVYPNRTHGAGENKITLVVGKTGEDGTLRPPSANAIRAEMRAALAGLNASMSPLLRDNVQGIYGYATASLPGGGSCIFAWQHVKALAPDGEATMFKFGATTRMSAQVRLRYCDPSIPVDRIVAFADGLRVKPMTEQTIDMLRFSAGSAQASRMPAVVAPVVEKPVQVAAAPRRVVRQVVEVEDDWRKDAEEIARDDEGPTYIENAAKIPLPENTKVRLPARHDAAVRVDTDGARPSEGSLAEQTMAKIKKLKPAFLDDADDTTALADDGATAVVDAAKVPLPQ